MTRKYFGTDGVRGLVGEGPINPEFVLKLGWAVGKVFAQRGRSTVLIGKDTRISGYMFESALEAGLVAAGVDVGLLGPMPTPAIAYLTRTFHAQAGVVISASHNPFHDNGIKFFSGDGTKLDDETELAIEAMLDEPFTTASSEKLGKVVRIDDAAGRYIEFCKSTTPMSFNLEGMKIVVDCAHGATYHIAPSVLHELGAAVIDIGTEPDGFNINDGVGSTSPNALRKKVLKTNADLGIALDGDGDRVMFVDHKGDFVDGDELLYIIARDRQERRGLCKGVAGTLMSNLGFELALKELEIPFARAKVGDRYVKELMEVRGWNLGGENSGHIICADLSSTGDGLIAALQVLHALRQSGMTLHDAKNQMSKFPQVMVNIKVADKAGLDNNPKIAAAVAEVERELAGRGRVLLRPSGTEPVVRVMVEGEQADKVTALCESLAAQVQSLVA